MCAEYLTWRSCVQTLQCWHLKLGRCIEHLSGWQNSRKISVLPELSCRTSVYSAWYMQEESLRLKKPCKFFSDEYRSAIYVADLASAVQFFLTEAPEAALGQTYNAGGPERLSRAEMAVAIAKHCGMDASVVDVAKSAAVTRTAPSPLDISMDSSKLCAVLPFQPQSFAKALQYTLAEQKRTPATPR
jgi:dTDP-4-dehydrorhamnose reductase